MPVCRTCEGTDYYEMEGFYYCRECNTQCPELRHTIQETEYVTQTISTVSEIFPASAPEATKKDLLFGDGKPESNFLMSTALLDAQVTWLRENAGATPDLRTVMLQTLWKGYLLRVMPDLGKGIEHVLTADGGRFTKLFSRGDQAYLLNCTTDELADVIKKLKLKDSEPVMEGAEDNPETDLPVTGANKEEKSKKTVPAVTAEKLSFPKVLSILALSLHHCGEYFYISDIIRWSRLLMLPCEDPTDFLPDSQFAAYLNFMGQPYDGIRYHELEWGMIQMKRLFEEPSGRIPAVPFKSNVSVPEMLLRFISELNLPKKLLPMVVQLMSIVPPSNFIFNENAAKPTYCQFSTRNLEAYSMSLIIIALRELFGFDDEAEWTIAEQSRLLQQSLGNKAKVFDFDKWVDYIDVRRLALFKYTSVLAKHSSDAAASSIAAKAMDESRKINWKRAQLSKMKDLVFGDLQDALKAEINTQQVTTQFLKVPKARHRPFRSYGNHLAHKFKIKTLTVDLEDHSVEHLLYESVDRLSYQVNRERKGMLEKISVAQEVSRERRKLLLGCNNRPETQTAPELELVPFLSMQWLITVCAEMIEHEPGSLIACIMAVEKEAI